eukprot:TRINITY_DN6022_c0_g1_i4.p1 TRINITY_DN6022_c0_g1~~TRINITY_DN6022_c0_g1_i4.p1  ORF type:complete len:595 (+),score=78.07 TRINITY_DN6022_c0_g1_i4:170-1954(+)
MQSVVDDQPFVMGMPGDSSCTPSSMKMLQELVEQLRYEVTATSLCRQEMQAEHTRFFSRQFQVLMRLERVGPTQHFLPCNEPIPTDQPFPLHSEQSRPEWDDVQKTSCDGSANSTACVPSPQLKTANHEAGVTSETRDQRLETTNLGASSHSSSWLLTKAKEVARYSRTQRSLSSMQSRRGCTFESFVRSRTFTRFFSCMAMANIAYLGISASMNLNAAIEGKYYQHVPYFRCIRFAFLVVFFVELVCNLWVESVNMSSSVSRRWLGLDALIVVLELADLVMDEIGLGKKTDGAAVSVLRLTRVVKALRFFRMMKALRFARGMRLIVLAIMSSLFQLFWALGLLLCIIYGFAVVFATTITDVISSSGSFNGRSDLIEWWGSLSQTSLTLFLSVSGGVNWITPFQALECSFWLQALFIAYLSFIVFAVLNVVTGVFCNNAVEMASRDPEMIIGAKMEGEENYIRDLHMLFHRVNKSGSSAVLFDELEESFKDPWIKAYLSHLEIEVDDAFSFFRLLDKDRNYDIDVTEFVDGCMKIRGNATALDMQVTTKQLQKLLREVKVAVLEIRETVVDSVASERLHSDEPTSHIGTQRSFR